MDTSAYSSPMAQGREKLDHYSIKAQKEGYPARSVYKLEELQEKYKILKPCQKVLDVGSSPGSWSLYVLRKFKPEGVWGVDLNPVNMGALPEKFHFRQGDIHDPKLEEHLKASAPFDVILSDAAPLTTGNRLVDTGRSYNLCERVVLLCETLLAPGGNVVVKIFQGGDEKQLEALMKESFTQVKNFKPKAVRGESMETYYIGLGKK